MSDLVGNPEDQFSHVEAHITFKAKAPVEEKNIEDTPTCICVVKSKKTKMVILKKHCLQLC